MKSAAQALQCYLEWGRHFKKQKMGPDEISGVLYSSLTTLEYSKMQSEFKTRLKKARTTVQKSVVNKEWKEIQKAA